MCLCFHSSDIVERTELLSHNQSYARMSGRVRAMRKIETALYDVRRTKEIISLGKFLN